MKSEWLWEYAYDRICTKITKEFAEMFEQKKKDSDERNVKIIAHVNGKSIELTEPITLGCIEIIEK